jgi:hypothetical protein
MTIKYGSRLHRLWENHYFFARGKLSYIDAGGNIVDSMGLVMISQREYYLTEVNHAASVLKEMGFLNSPTMI